jgi:hypothetical protein
VENYLLHTDFTWGFRIKYPGEWRKLAMSPISIGFFSPPESPNDVFQDNVTVSIDETTVGLGEFVDFELSKLRKLAPNLRLEKPSEVTLANLPAQEVEMSGKLGPYFRSGQAEMMPIGIVTVWVLKGKRVYSLTYTAEKRAYEKFMPQFRVMLDSFEFVNT